MHITTMFESQAIALLHEVCDALGIEPENRTREEIRMRLKSLDSHEPQFSAAYSETGPGWSDDEPTELGNLLIELISNTDSITSASRHIDYDGETFHVSVRRGERGDTDFE